MVTPREWIGGRLADVLDLVPEDRELVQITIDVTWEKRTPGEQNRWIWTIGVCRGVVVTDHRELREDDEVIS